MSYEKTDAQQSGRSIYDITNKWVEQIEPENNQLIFCPFKWIECGTAGKGDHL